ncbi:hypothetical protein ELI_2337 [Eubacterium callanderi]|uniref:Uncharacterized protein n=1 Tax=Eubacterium callanderi TaxID=53442 RepID=E3GNS7_9FIRM|nr:hypothetical protein ELI_2337 [Eubacterium callanderi]
MYGQAPGNQNGRKHGTFKFFENFGNLLEFFAIVLSVGQNIKESRCFHYCQRML